MTELMKMRRPNTSTTSLIIKSPAIDHGGENDSEDGGNKLGVLTPVGPPFSYDGLRQRRTTGSTLFSNNKTTIPSTTMPPPRASTLVASTATTTDVAELVDEIIPTMGTTTRTMPDDSDDNAIFSCSRWVIVYGFHTSTIGKEILQRFESFGTVVRSATKHDSNWIALRYATELQAEKACCQNGTMVKYNNTVILVGVLRCTAQLSNQLGLPNLLLTADLGDTQSTTKRQDGITALNNKDAAVDENDILLLDATDSSYSKNAAGKKKGIIESILAWFFLW